MVLFLDCCHICRYAALNPSSWEGKSYRPRALRQTSRLARTLASHIAIDFVVLVYGRSTDPRWWKRSVGRAGNTRWRLPPASVLAPAAVTPAVWTPPAMTMTPGTKAKVKSKSGTPGPSAAATSPMPTAVRHSPRLGLLVHRNLRLGLHLRHATQATSVRVQKSGSLAVVYGLRNPRLAAIY